jgi:hypothetical protein
MRHVIHYCGQEGRLLGFPVRPALGSREKRYEFGMRLRGAQLSMNSRTVIADLESVAAFEFDNAPAWLYRQPSSGVG